MPHITGRYIIHAENTGGDLWRETTHLSAVASIFNTTTSAAICGMKWNLQLNIPLQWDSWFIFISRALQLAIKTLPYCYQC